MDASDKMGESSALADGFVASGSFAVRFSPTAVRTTLQDGTCELYAARTVAASFNSPVWTVPTPEKSSLLPTGISASEIRSENALPVEEDSGSPSPSPVLTKVSSTPIQASDALPATSSVSTSAAAEPSLSTLGSAFTEV